MSAAAVRRCAPRYHLRRSFGPALLLCTLSLGAGCHLIFPFNATPPLQDDLGANDGLTDSVPFLDLADLQTPPGDLPPADLGPPCASTIDNRTLALFDFEGLSGNKTLIDKVGTQDGLIMQPLFVTRKPGMPGCGQALVFSATSTKSATAQIPDHKLWQLPDGSLDLWVRFDTFNDRPMGVVAKDAIGMSAGHLLLVRNCNGRLIVRFQSNTQQVYRCSNVVNLDTWVHVGINFGKGGLALFVNGVKSDPKTTAEWADNCTGSPLTVPCGEAFTLGLASNTNPWILGGLSKNAKAGTTTNVISPLSGAIDSLRISDSPRAFDLSTR